MAVRHIVLSHRAADAVDMEKGSDTVPLQFLDQFLLHNRVGSRAQTVVFRGQFTIKQRIEQRGAMINKELPLPHAVSVEQILDLLNPTRDVASHWVRGSARSSHQECWLSGGWRGMTARIVRTGQQKDGRR